MNDLAFISAHSPEVLMVYDVSEPSLPEQVYEYGIDTYSLYVIDTAGGYVYCGSVWEGLLIYRVDWQ